MRALPIRCTAAVAAVILGVGPSAAGEFVALAVNPDGAWDGQGFDPSRRR